MFSLFFHLLKIFYLGNTVGLGCDWEAAAMLATALGNIARLWFKDEKARPRKKFPLGFK